jgi:diadenosine tetraphosphate (Ap4A) HIT family hydrolase
LDFMNTTIKTFGYPSALIKEYKHWIVLLRPKQITIGSLVIASKSEATSLGNLSQDEWAEFSVVTKETEDLLKVAFGAEKFNYLALMMKDPNVHFHLVPRYSKPVKLHKKEFIDEDWPLKTEMKPIDLSQDEFDMIMNELNRR